MENSKMKKIIVTSIMVLAISLSSVFAGGGALFKFIGDSIFLNQKLSTGVASYGNRTVIRNNISIALENFTKKGNVFNMKDLKSRLRYIKNPQDKAMLQRVITILEKDVDDVTSLEVIKLSNRLAILSQRYGFQKLGILSCTKCADFKAASDTVVYKLERVSNHSLKHIYKKVISRKKNPKQMISYINSQLNAQGLGRLTNIAKHEEESLAVFLSIDKYRKGNTSGLAPLYDSIVAMSKTGSKIDIFDPKDGHKLWKIPSEVKTPEEAILFTDLFKVVAIKRQKEGIGTYDALDRVLKEAIENEPDQAIKKDLELAYEKWIKKGCYKR
jgi:hypothetical protein